MKRYLFLAALLAFTVISCSRNDQASPRNQSDPVLELDSLRIIAYNTFKVYGSVKVPEWIKDATYGIVYTYDSIPTVETSTVVSLGAAKDSIYLARVLDNLHSGKNYYFRIFVKGEGKIWYSLEQQLSTHQLKIESIHAAKTSRNALMGISVNMEFPDVVPPADLEVLLGDHKVMVTETSYNNIFFKIPEGMPAGDYKIKVKRGNYSAESIGSVRVLEGIWRDLPKPAFSPRSRSAYFVLNNKGYIIGGVSSPLIMGGTNEIWEYDLASGVWMQKRNFPTDILWDAVGFALNGKGYVLGGVSAMSSGSNYIYNTYVWEYDPGLDAWTKKASHPDLRSIRKQTTGVVYNSKIYFGMGASSTDGLYRDLLEYNPANNVWKDLAALPDMGRKGSAAFSIDGKIYLVGGDVFSETLDDFWSYDFATNTWTRMPGKPVYERRTGAAAIPVDNMAYVYGGAYLTLLGGGYGFISRSDCWKFDATIGTWTEVAPYTGNSAPLCLPVIFPTSTGFILYGGSSGDLWQSSDAFVEFIAN